MVKLDAVKAAFAGFGVIGRNPLAVLVWAAFLGIVGILPVAAMLGSFAGALLPIIEAAQADVEPSTDQILAMLAPLFGFIPILIVTGLIVRVVLTGAVFRAVLFPNESSWFYLRLGARELWLALLTIVIGILGFFASMFSAFVSVVPAAILSASVDDPVMQMLIIRAAMLPYYALMIFLAVRFCLAFPMTFAESHFRLFESWSATRGNGWRILLMFLLLIALVIAAEIVILILAGIVIAVVAGGVAVGGGFSEESLEAFFQQPPAVWMHALMPWIAGLCVAASVLGALATAIFVAPLAEAWRQLRGAGEAGSDVAPA